VPISFTSRGNWDKTTDNLRRLKSGEIFAALDKYGAMGAAALASATPTESGLSAASWTYEVERRRGYYSIRWSNTNEVNGTPLVVLLQYGHGTGTGGYVQGRDFIMPAIRPIFDQIEEEIRKVVSG
jgi:hypothetical protein